MAPFYIAAANGGFYGALDLPQHLSAHVADCGAQHIYGGRRGKRLVAMEHADMDEVVTITASDVALSADSQVCGLAEGDQIQLSELFHALLVYSANDAAMAIARTVGDVRRLFFFCRRPAECYSIF